MKKSSFFVLLLASLVFAMPLAPAHASPVATSLPGVKPGDTATYLWHFDWQTNNATAFPNPFPNFYNLTIRVLAVSGANVTFTQTVFLTNGTGGGVTDVVNVQTQDLCISNGLPPNQGPPVCGGEGLLGSAILAAGLQAPQAIGANPSVILNQTVARTILGAQRTLNFLNETTSSSPQTTAFSIAWDQTSGIIAGEVFLESLSSSQGSANGTISLVMMNTNIWATSNTDFGIVANPSSITIQGGQTGISTITVSALNGFSGTVNLRVETSSAQLSCSLNRTSLTVRSPANSTISCFGSQGSYTMTVTGTGGNLSHSVTLTCTVLHGHRPPRPAATPQ